MKKGGKKIACRILRMVVPLLICLSDARAEYGDVVINSHAEAAGMRPVIFPHWFHRIRFTCNACHADLGFKLKAGESGINMAAVMEGKFCGACHNGKIAWGIENCNTCHSGKPGLQTQVLERTVPRFVALPPGEAVPENALNER